jgi:hypothetical protein
VDPTASRFGSPRRIGVLLTYVMATVLLLTVGAAPAASASPKACRVTNASSGQTYPGLQAAVDAAKRSDRLTVRGVCHGGTVIDKSLVIEGVTTPTSGEAILDGDREARVMLVGSGIRVKLRGLVIRDGDAHIAQWVTKWRDGDPRYVGRCAGGDVSCGRMGGGIHNKGTLVLRDVVVRDNVAGYTGGGIQNNGTLTLHGSTRVTGNAAGRWGGGVATEGTVTMNDTSRIDGNRAGGQGGGLYSTGRSVTMNDQSSISDNRSRFDGGGASISGTVTMNGESRISGNRSRRNGGGLRSGSLTMNDRSSISANFARHTGGGVSNGGGPITLNDQSSISGNQARLFGGGVDSLAAMTLNGESRISGNTAGTVGGGVANSSGMLTLNDASSISGNRVVGQGGTGGGVSDRGGTIVNDAASITGNSASGGGGGIYFIDPSTRPHIFVCAPAEGANVYGNSPDDCLSHR